MKVSLHGGVDYAELKAMNFTPEEVLDFSGGSNAFKPPPGIRKALNSLVISQYPDSEATELRQHLSEKLGMTPENIMAGNGAVELIRLIALTYFGRGDSVLVLAPTFGEYEVACQIAGAEVFKQWSRAEENFAPRVEETVRLTGQSHPKGIFICNPNNPTGQYLSRQEIEAILEAGVNTMLILDEAYITYVDGSWSSHDLISRDNVVVVRSMTKDYALAGLRLGYAMANREIIDNLRRVRPPWNVNVVAQKAGIIALEDADYLERCEQKVRQAKQFLTAELQRIGFAVVPSQANFFLLKAGDAKGFRSALLKHGMLVRDCTSFGLPEYVRITPRTMPECRKLIATIKALKREEKL
jgi:histidinol-phosphate aminotransferase